MYVDANTIISLASLLGALLAIGGVLVAVLRWVEKQNKQDDDIKQLRAENGLIVQTLFAILDGQKQQGCNGEVTKAHDLLREHLNRKAHEV